MMRIATLGALGALALTTLAPPAAAQFSAIGEACSIELGRAAKVEHFADMKQLYDAARDADDAPAESAATAAAALCAGPCEAGTPIDLRNGEAIHVAIPDANGGAALLRGMGWIGGASACSIGEPVVKRLADGLYRFTIDERSGEFANDEKGDCANEQTATSVLLLDLAQKRWLVYAVALGGDDALDVKEGRVKARACGRTLDASVAALVAGEAQLSGAAAPVKPPAPAADAIERCETIWPKATDVDRATTWACLTHYLTYGYGEPPTAELMSLDPTYGHPVEVALSVADLDRMIASVEATCDVQAAPVESECARGHEMLEGMKTRRLGISVGVNLVSIEPQLRKVLAGEALTKADVFADSPGPQLSPLSLWKLRNAAYARHGYRFKTPDLNTFFYGPRQPVGEPKLLPLSIKGATGKVTLSTADGENVRLIKLLEARAKAR